MISYRFVPISSQKGVLFLRHPVSRLLRIPEMDFKSKHERILKKGGYIQISTSGILLLWYRN